MEKNMLTDEEKKELETQAQAVVSTVFKKLLGPLLTLFAFELGLAGWLTWLTWNHTAAAVIWTVAVIVKIVSFGMKYDTK